MILFEKFTLKNGLRVVVHQDKSTPMVAMSVLYDVGARDEDPEKTGFAHLFEHLMFGGSLNIPKYDEPLEKAGGTNNAYTTNDITNYYLSLPSQNLETAFWLESDRMNQLAFSDKSLEVQRNVVTEEFRQTHLNKPYGDAWLILRPLAYTVHPYRWPTIGKEISHIQQAVMDDVRAFYHKFYNPNNAVMAIAGKVEYDEIKRLAEKWFEPIENFGENNRNLPKEPEQKEARFLEVERSVPADMIYKTWKMCDRLHHDYYATDLLSDVLGNGNSSRFYRRLVMEQNLFTELDAYVTGNFDEGLFVISGKPSDGITLEEADKAINDEISRLQNGELQMNELQKVKNKVEANLAFSRMNALNKAINLAFGELMGDAGLLNTEIDKYQAVTTDHLLTGSKHLLTPEKCSTLYYRAKK
ncbi:MAG: insulinase family protein [Bacteroidales bacterium]|nr:insulinase family protein [Bacteroidales bacterium]